MPYIVKDETGRRGREKARRWERAPGGLVNESRRKMRQEGHGGASGYARLACRWPFEDDQRGKGWRFELELSFWASERGEAVSMWVPDNSGLHHVSGNEVREWNGGDRLDRDDRDDRNDRKSTPLDKR